MARAGRKISNLDASRVSADVPPELGRRVRTYAIASGRSLSTVIREALEAHLRDREEQTEGARTFRDADSEALRDLKRDIIARIDDMTEPLARSIAENRE